MIPANLTPIADHLWQSTLVVAAAWLLSLTLRQNRAAVRHRLWVVASVKFLIPFSLLVSLGARIPWRSPTTSAPPKISIVVDAISRPFASSDRSIAPSVAPSVTAPLPQTQAQSSRFLTILVSLWIAGFLVNMTWWSFSWLRLRRAMRRATTLPLQMPIRVMSSPQRMEPGVFGIFKPVLLLPEGIEERLSAAQLDSVVAHELCHVRRRDNLTAAIHMFVEALFWFHPLVWWIKARLIDEQERACDEEVLRLGGDRHAYAQSILKICELYLTSPVLCVSGITGANLKRRIADIMRGNVGLQLGFSRSALLAIVATTALAIPIATGVVHATALLQIPAPPRVSAEPATVAEPVAAPNPVRPVVEIASTRFPIPTRVAPVEAVTPATPQAGDFTGRWEIRSIGPGRVQLSFRTGDNGNSSNSLTFDPSTFRGLSEAQINSPIRAGVRFEIVRDAGTFVCEGEFQAGFGAGQFMFRPNPAFVQRMAAEGVQDIGDRQLLGMALVGMSANYVSELRSAGLPVPSFNELMGMWVQGLTGQYIREIQQAGYTVNGNELIGMKVQGVTPEFARDVRQTFPSTSANELIGMKVQGVTSDFVREVRQEFPSTSINELIGMRVQGVTMEFAREVRREFASASINQLIGMRVQGVTMDFVRDARRTNPNASIDEIIGMKVLGGRVGR